MSYMTSMISYFSLQLPQNRTADLKLNIYLTLWLYSAIYGHTNFIGLA